MSEIWFRLALVAGAVLVAVAVGSLLRAMRQGRPIAIDPGDLRPGVYLFSSRQCLDCEPSRDQLVDALGADGFVEVKWEEEPERFREHGINSVPATIVVGDDGSGTLISGAPGAAVRRFNP
jgi:hypothetical protein